MKPREKRFLPASFIVKSGNKAPFEINIMGHTRWALELLIAGGEHGCKPIDHPLPRWAANISSLRINGVYIETLHGIYTCYILHSKVEPVKTEDISE